MGVSSSKPLKKSIHENIKSKYILQVIFANLREKKLLKLIKYNKNIQSKLNRDINDYIKYYEYNKKIIIEIITISKNYKNYFIKYKEEDERYFHIYFNDEKEEILLCKNYFDYDKNVTKIKIIIDEQITSFEGLFSECICIEKINFIKFNRKDITDMSYMFYKCKSLKEINFYNFNTTNVTDMSSMFFGCTSLEKLYIKNFNTINVINMSFIFGNCVSLKYLNLNNFNTNNVTNMSSMFNNCESLEVLHIDNFNTVNVTDMRGMFWGCSYELEKKLRNLNLNIKEEAFHTYYI